MANMDVQIQPDPCNTTSNAVWIWRLSASGPQAKAKIAAEVKILVESRGVLDQMWDEDHGRVFLLILAMAPVHQPRAANAPRVVGKMAKEDRRRLLRLYQEEGIQACYAAFPGRSQASIAGILNRLGTQLIGARCRPRRAEVLR